MNEEFDPVQEEIQAAINNAIAKAGAGSAPAAKPSSVVAPRSFRGIQLPAIGADLNANRPTLAPVMPTGLPTVGGGVLDLGKREALMQQYRDDLIRGMAGDDASKRTAISQAKRRKAELDAGAGLTSGRKEKFSGTEETIAYFMGDKQPNPARILAKGAVNALGYLPANLVGRQFDYASDVAAGKAPSELDAMKPWGSQHSKESVARRELENAQSQVFDRYDNTGTWDKIKEAGSALATEKGIKAAGAGLVESLYNPMDMGMNLATMGIPMAGGKMLSRGATAAVRAAKAAAPLTKADVAIGTAKALGQSVVDASVQPLLERGSLNAQEFALGTALGLPLYGAAAGIGAGLKKLKKPALDAGIQPDLTEAVNVGPVYSGKTRYGNVTRGTSVDAPALDVNPNAAVEPVPTKMTPEAFSMYTKAVGDGTNPPSRDALIEVLRKDPKNKDARAVIEHMGKEHPEMVSDLVEQADAHNQSLATIAKGVDVTDHLKHPADVLADQAKADATSVAPAAPKPLTPSQEARVKKALGGYIKADEDLTKLTPQQIKTKMNNNHLLDANGVLPADAHPAFSKQSDAMLEVNRLETERAATDADRTNAAKEAESIKADNKVVESGDAITNLMLSNEHGKAGLDDVSLEALVKAIEVDSKRGGTFRQRLEQHLAPEQVDKLITASKMGTSAKVRHEWMRGAITGETPDVARAKMNEASRLKEENAAVDAEIDLGKDEATKVATEAETARKKAEADLEKQNKADEAAHNESEDAAMSDAGLENTLVSAMWTMQRNKPTTGKTTGQIDKIAKERTAASIRAAKAIASSKALASRISDLLPPGQREQFNNLVKVLRNMENPHAEDLSPLASLLSKIDDKIVAPLDAKPEDVGNRLVPNERERVPFVKKALPLQ